MMKSSSAQKRKFFLANLGLSPFACRVKYLLWLNIDPTKKWKNYFCREGGMYWLSLPPTRSDSIRAWRSPADTGNCKRPDTPWLFTSGLGCVRLTLQLRWEQGEQGWGEFLSKKGGKQEVLFERNECLLWGDLQLSHFLFFLSFLFLHLKNGIIYIINYQPNLSVCLTTILLPNCLVSPSIFLSVCPHVHPSVCLPMLTHFYLSISLFLSVCSHRYLDVGGVAERLEKAHFVRERERKRQTDRQSKAMNNHHTLHDRPGNTKGGSITVLLTSCLTGLD